MPYTRADTTHTGRIQAALPILARLTELGVLPAVAPRRHDSIYGLLHRMTKQSAPLEFLPLNLTWYEGADYVGYAEADVRSPHELALTLEHESQCVAWTCLEARDEMRALHPWLFGSLLYHVSVASQTTFPIYTARDATLDEEAWDFEGSFAAFWRGAAHEYRDQHGRQPTPEELSRFVSEERGKTPSDLFHLLGQDEWVPVRSERRRLSVGAMVQLCEARPERPWARRTLEILADLAELYAVDQELKELGTFEDYAGRLGTGEARPHPVAALSASVSGSRAYAHAVQERLEECWQMAAQTNGFFENLFVRLNDEADAERAAKVLRLYAQAWQLVQDIIARLIDGDE